MSFYEDITDIDSVKQQMKDILKEYWLIYLLMAMLIIGTIYHYNTVAACNDYYQEILKGCLLCS